MKHARLALRFAVVTLAIALYLEPGPAGDFGRKWMALVSASAGMETVAVIETEKPASALDIALTLRATLRYEPKGFVFLDPITNLEGLPLLLSKLGDARQPVTFTTNAGLQPLTGVRIGAATPSISGDGGFTPPDRTSGCEPSGVVARSGNHAVASSPLALLLALNHLAPASAHGAVPGTVRAGPVIAPVNAAGHATINPLAAKFIERITLDRLMVRAERSEHGEITVDLDNLFHGRLIAVQTANGNGATLLAALQNGLIEAPAPAWVTYVAVLLAASLPWWRAGRFPRCLVALLATGWWLLIALDAYQEARIVVPILPALLLPFLALIPRSSHETE
jgi:hypothetical protein